MNKDSVLSLAGLAKKAGKILSGEFQTEAAVKSGKARLVIISQEASGPTKKKFRNMCAYYQVPVYCYGSKEQLGAAIGCAYRATLAVADAGFAQALEKKLMQQGIRKEASEQSQQQCGPTDGGSGTEPGAT